MCLRGAMAVSGLSPQGIYPGEATLDLDTCIILLLCAFSITALLTPSESSLYISSFLYLKEKTGKAGASCSLKHNPEGVNRAIICSYHRSASQRKETLCHRSKFTFHHNCFHKKTVIIL